MSNTVHISDWEAVAVPPASAALDPSTFPASDDHDAQVAAFERDGFVFLPGFLSPDLIAQVEADLDWACRNYTEITPVREGFNVEDPSKWSDPETPVFRKVGGLLDLSPAWRELCVSVARDSVLPRLLGPEVDLWRDVVMMKQARVGREKPWHQDGVYWPYRPFHQVSAFCPLDACTAENGALQVIPGSHLRERDHFGVEKQVTLTDEEQASARYVFMQPGDVLLFHSLLLHGSEPNQSNHHRRVAINSYLQRGLTYIYDDDEPQCPQVLG